jgi:hypothetical protein
LKSPILFGDPCFAPPPSDATAPGGTRNPIGLRAAGCCVFLLPKNVGPTGAK